MRPPRFDTAQLSLVRAPFDHPDFLFELKHDGFRALAHIWDGNCELISRKRNAYKSFNELRENLANLKVQNAVIDGEIVCLDEEGRSIFNELLFRRGSPIFYGFQKFSRDSKRRHRLLKNSYRIVYIYLKYVLTCLVEYHINTPALTQ
jgi:hypothetical protein